MLHIQHVLHTTDATIGTYIHITYNTIQLLYIVIQRYSSAIVWCSWQFLKKNDAGGVQILPLLLKILQPSQNVKEWIRDIKQLGIVFLNKF